MERIFISIAAYRDPELLPTIEDCIRTVSDPKRLNIAVCHQFDDSDESAEFISTACSEIHEKIGNLCIISIPYKKSKGVCWARNKIQQKYAGEEYVLQLDSHHRFIQDWDLKLIEEIKSLQAAGYNKPLLTAYLPSYEPNNDPDGRINTPWELAFDRYLPQGPAMPIPEQMRPKFIEMDRSAPARLYSAHFVFSIGDLYKEVVYDPDFYFHGEEIALAVRAYTHGYDLFTPHFLVMWHHYTRLGCKRHWDDRIGWEENNKTCFDRYKQLVECEDTGIDLGEYGLGTERSLDDFIHYSGLDLRNKRVHKKVLNREYPPLEYEDENDFESGFCRKIKYCVNLYRESVKLDDYDCWVVAFKNKDGVEVYRQDCDKGEIASIKAANKEHENFYFIWREYEDNEDPVEWLVWPHSESQGWCDIIRGDISHEE